MTHLVTAHVRVCLHGGPFDGEDHVERVVAPLGDLPSMPVTVTMTDSDTQITYVYHATTMLKIDDQTVANYRFFE